MKLFMCKICQKKGSKEQIKNHTCVDNSIINHETEDDFYMSTIFIGTDDPEDTEIPIQVDDTPAVPDAPEVDGGGGEFAGGGSSDSYESNS